MPDTITSKNLPPMQAPTVRPATPLPGLKPSVEFAIPYEQIEARPLRSPNFINLKAKNPNLSLYWGNRAVGEKESGLRYDQLIAMGFIPAKPDEVVSMEGHPCPPSICRDGRIMYGDLILLKMSREAYVGALKWNDQNARLRVKKLGVALSGDSRERQATDTRQQPTQALNIPSSKVSIYVPAIAETDAKTADNSGPVNLAEK
jgi:hypothetical protein